MKTPLAWAPLCALALSLFAGAAAAQTMPASQPNSAGVAVPVVPTWPAPGSPGTSPSSPTTSTLVDSSGNPVNYNNTVATGPAYIQQTFSTTAPVTWLFGNNGDVSGYRHASLHTTSIGTAAIVTFFQSEDGLNWTVANFDNAAPGSAGGVSTATAGIELVAPIHARYLEAVVTAQTGGTTAIVLTLWTTPPSADFRCHMTTNSYSPGNVPCPAVGAMYEYDPTHANQAASTASMYTGRVSTYHDHVITPAPGDATDGWTLTSLGEAASNNGALIKSTAGLFGCLHVWNNNSSWVYIKVFNVASPTFGTTSALLDIGIPPNGRVDAQGDIGGMFTTAIYWGVSAQAGLTGSTAVAAGTVGGYACTF